MPVLGGKKQKLVDTRLSVRYIDDELVVSDTHVWTYMRLPVEPYEFLAYDKRKDIAERLFLTLSALVTSTESVDVHLLVTTRPVAVAQWSEALNTKVARWGPAPGWPDYLNAMGNYLYDQEFLAKEVFIGVCLGHRKNLKDDSFLAPFKTLLTKGEQSLGYDDDVVSERELGKFRTHAQEVRRSLSQSHARAVGVDAHLMAWLIRKPLYPAMDCPDVADMPHHHWGAGETQMLADGMIVNGHKSLEIHQTGVDGIEEVGHVATLALSRFPDQLMFPDQEPWIHFASSLSFPVDFSSRLTLVPPTQVKKDVSRKLAGVKDQAEHIAQTGASVPLDVQEQYNRATTLEYTINKDRIPWAYGRHRIMVHGETKEELFSRCKRVIEHYRDLAIEVTWPSGDQFDLLRECQPADKIRCQAYFQRQELLLIAGGMPTASSEVGDRKDGPRGWIGPYIGETTSRVRSQVNFSPHVAPTRNYPPGVAITGAPGGGKSFLAFTLAYQMAVQGVWTIYIDPKADAKPMANIQGLGRPRMFDLRDGHDGMLDPFALAEDNSQATLLAVETLRLLIGGHMSESREEALLQAVSTVAKEPEPSLSKVVTLLQQGHTEVSRSLGLMLETIQGMPFARLCFASRTESPIRPQDGLTVITLLGLDLPNADMATEDYSYENRLAVAVMYLLTRFARGLMLSMDKSHPKAICIDEAWAVTSTPQGAKLIPEIARMGRSHNTVPILVSQNAGDLMAESVTNSLSTMFAFRSDRSKEIGDILDLFNMEQSEGHRRSIRELRNGECLMKDVDGRIARVQIDSWNSDLFTAFNTNPEARGT